MVRTYELNPNGIQKSFNGKAYVIEDNYTKTLYSYCTPIMRQDKHTGKQEHLWDGWSATTGKHIKAFCGLNKAGYESLPMGERD